MIDYEELKKLLDKIGDFCWNFDKECEECPLRIKGGTSCIFMSPDFTNDTASQVCYDENIYELIEVLKKAEKLED
ncbi:MAG: hypothetical protein J6U54_07600 [Clostridiales bacterium]|nr:hypothetical protein [Clostridiales bacterium]